MLKISLRILAGLVLLAVLVVVAAGVFLSRGKPLGERHRPSGFTETFDYANSGFEDYVAWSDRRIRASRVDSPSGDTVSNLLPFILEPDADCPVNPGGKYANGVVMVHGLIDSPWSMKEMGGFFQSDCFYVLGVLLPGHGTRPGDMLDSHWEDWDRTVQFATRILSEKADRVFLAGHSDGGTLSVLEATRNPDVNALILFSPAMKIAPVARYARYPALLGKLFPAAAWYELGPDEAVYRYESFPFSAVAETWDLIQTTQQALATNPLTIPVMTVASAQDGTVDVQAIIDFMGAQANPLSNTLLYSEYGLPSYRNTRIYNSNAPDRGILSVGHLGLMTPPDHPWYGRNGAYRYCLQYYGRPGDSYARCKAGQRDFYGETTPDNLAAGLIERIAFNPFYDELLDDIELFIEQVTMDRRGLPITPERNRLNRLGPDD